MNALKSVARTQRVKCEHSLMSAFLFTCWVVTVICLCISYYYLDRWVSWHHSRDWWRLVRSDGWCNFPRLFPPFELAYHPGSKTWPGLSRQDNPRIPGFPQENTQHSVVEAAQPISRKKIAVVKDVAPCRLQCRRSVPQKYRSPTVCFTRSWE